jgi:hypothetical protein
MTSVAEGLSYENPRDPLKLRNRTCRSGCSWPQRAA